MHVKKVFRFAARSAAAVCVLTVGGCGHASAPPTVDASPSSRAVDPNAPEVVEPGDIPDDQVFVPYTSPDHTFSVDIPEGWARSVSGTKATFTDKYNSITITNGPAATAPTRASVTERGLADVRSDPSFRLRKVSEVTRTSGPGVLATYDIGSPANSVTGKKALLSVERYFFAHQGHQVVLTLAGAKGADNVDPWRVVTDSLAWK